MGSGPKWGLRRTFGLLHGLGFAGALTEIGLPEKAVPLALLCFNVGVEIGQLLFVAFVPLLSLFSGPGCRDGGSTLQWTQAYAIGGIASYWLIERVAMFAK